MGGFLCAESTGAVGGTWPRRGTSGQWWRKRLCPCQQLCPCQRLCPYHTSKKVISRKFDSTNWNTRRAPRSNPHLKYPAFAEDKVKRQVQKRNLSIKNITDEGNYRWIEGLGGEGGLSWPPLEPIEVTWIHLRSTFTQCRSFEFMWPNVNSLALTWSNLKLFELIWTHLNSSEFNWMHVISPELLWTHSSSVDCIFNCVHLFSFCFIWYQLILLDCIFFSFAFICFH